MITLIVTSVTILATSYYLINKYNRRRKKLEIFLNNIGDLHPVKSDIIYELTTLKKKITMNNLAKIYGKKKINVTKMKYNILNFNNDIQDELMTMYNFLKKNNDASINISTNSIVNNKLEKMKIENIVFWIGGGNQYTPLHFDHDDGWLCVIKGYKKIRLIHPKYTKYLKPFIGLMYSEYKFEKILFVSVYPRKAPLFKKDGSIRSFDTPYTYKERVNSSRILHEQYGNIVEEVNIFYDIENLESSINSLLKKEYIERVEAGTRSLNEYMSNLGSSSKKLLSTLNDTKYD